jgi:hypothetical protein
VTAAGRMPQRAAARMAWLCAVVLLALALAGAAPAVPGVGGGEARLEQCDAASVRSVAARRLAGAAVVQRRTADAAAAPRPRPRVRDVHRRGLPPARAPTC